MPARNSTWLGHIRIWSDAAFEFAGGGEFHVGEFGDAAAAVLIGAEGGVEIGQHEILRQPGADDLGADAHDVDVIVFDALVGGVDVVADGGADAGDFVGGDGGADAGAADHDAALRLAGLDGTR